jgi:hypothetical protein
MGEVKEKIGVPTINGIKESLIDYALGIGGGLLYGLSTAFLGSGLFGGIAGACLAGATIKGVKGEVIATMLGFHTGLTMIAANASSSSGSNSRGVM